MKILALEKELPEADAEEIRQLLPLEAWQAYQLYQAGWLRELYFRQDMHTAVLILECANLEEACSVLGSLPLIEEGLISFDLIPLVPYSGFARLFSQEYRSFQNETT